MILLSSLASLSVRHPPRRTVGSKLRSAGVCLALTLLSTAPVAADPGDPDPLYGGGDGTEAFELGMSFEICALDVTTDGTAIVVLGTAAGSEIWRVEPNGTQVRRLRTYPFAGSPDCSQGLQDVICPAGTG